MKYYFQDILNEEVYSGSRVLFIFGKYNIFSNIVSDELKARCVGNTESVNTIGVAEEFGFDTDDTEEGAVSTSVDFNTFLNVIGVPNINGRWFCKVDLASLTKKQKDTLQNYIKSPSENGVLVVTSTEWIIYKDFLNNRVLGNSKYSNLMQLSFPHKVTLHELVKQMFSSKGMTISSGAIDIFIIKMNNAYDEYEMVIDNIKTLHDSDEMIADKDIKEYMKGIEHFDVESFIYEVVKPLSSEKTNSKKVLKMLIALQDEIGAKNLVYQLIKKIDESIEYRTLINTGYIPIGIKYFFGDVIKSLGGEQGKYGKVKEWNFRKKAQLAASTSLRDWQYMKFILTKAIEDVKVTDRELEVRCQKALYELCTRSVLTDSRINNIIGIDNVLNKNMEKLNSLACKL